MFKWLGPRAKARSSSHSWQIAVGMLMLFFALPAWSVTISSFWPVFGQQGNVITLTGAGFNGVTSVGFNMSPTTLGDFTNVSDSQLLVVVPPGAVSGPLELFVNSASTASSSNFLVAPVVSAFYPQSGTNPTVVSILGQNFISGGTKVLFSGASTAVSATYVSSTEVAATVPSGAGNGPIMVMTSAGTNISATNFLASAVPTISSISPNLATNGQTVYIFGGNFFSGASVKFGSVSAANPDIVSTTEIAATVPNGANGNDIIVTTSFGSATNDNFSTSSGPIITNFSPTIGTLNTPVTIYGSGLSFTDVVTFNGYREYVAGYGNGYLQVTLTNNSATGPIKITAGSSSFTTPNNFTNSTAPFLDSFNPTLGPPGSIVTLNGENLTASTTVKFGATVTSSTYTGETQISAHVPTNTVGNYTITLENSSGSVTGSSNFNLTGSAPVVEGFSQAFGVRGGTVTISGANFTNLSSVQFNGVTGTYQTLTSTTELMATVPADATTGPVSVVNNNGTGESTSIFYMQPWITSLNTNGGIVNAQFTVNGRNFTNASSITVNGLSYNFTNSAAQIVATIPSNATSGQIVITAPGGIYISTNSFGILPKIYSFSPNIGPAGTVVTIKGTSLFDVTGVKFGGVNAPTFTTGTNQMEVTVPSGGASGPLTVITPYGNDISTNSFTVTEPSLVVLTKIATPVVAAPGSNITYTLQVTNEGPSIITSAQVTDDMPGSLFTVSSTTASGGSWYYTNGILIWNIGILTNSNSVTLDVTGTCDTATELTNSATLSFAEGNLAPYDNYASIISFVVYDYQRTLSIARQANPPGVSITWPVSPANFLLQVSSNLASSWTYPTNATLITNGENTYTDSFTLPQRFYRLTPP